MLYLTYNSCYYYYIKLLENITYVIKISYYKINYKNQIKQTKTNKP